VDTLPRKSIFILFSIVIVIIIIIIISDNTLSFYADLTFSD